MASIFQHFSAALRLSASQRIAVPADYAYARATDFKALEARARRAGLRADRVSEVPPAWDVSVPFRGKMREGRLEVMDMRKNESLTLSGTGRLFGIQFRTLFLVRDARTEVRVDIAVRPQSIAGRLALQSLKLGRSRLTKALRGRLDAAAHSLEAEYRNAGRSEPERRRG